MMRTHNKSFHNSGFYFIVLLFLAVIGFWQSYFSKLFGDIDSYIHFHAITIMLWVGMLKWCATSTGCWVTNACACCRKDEGRSLGAVLQEEASNHLKLRRLRPLVVSVKEHDFVRQVLWRRMQMNL